MLKNFAAAIVYYSGIPFLIREFIQRNKVTIILYHDLEAGLFKKHIHELLKRYSLISLNNFLLARKDSSVILPEKSLIITFDDGHKNNYNLLSFIKEQKVPITIFVCSSIIDSKIHFWFMKTFDKYKFGALRKMPDDKRVEALKECGFNETAEYDTRQALNKDEIREMKDCVDFQSHTRFHPILPTCHEARAEDEIRGSKTELEEKFGLKINSISYPNGDYSERDIELTKRAGYECGITVDPGFNTLNTDPFRLKRICIDDRAGKYAFLLQICGFWHFVKNLFVKKQYGYTR